MCISCINVSYFWEHIGRRSVCSHEVGTFSINPRFWTVYTKYDIQFRKDEAGVYHYKDKTFHLKDGWFISDKLRLKLPTRTEISTIERLALSLGMRLVAEDIATEIDVTVTPFRNVMSMLTTFALKDLSILHNGVSQKKQLKYGEVVFGAYLMAVGGSGRINATQKDIRWLNEQDTLKLKARLFDTSDSSYRVGGYSMKYTPTTFAESIFSTVFELLKAVEFKQATTIPQVMDFIVPMNLLKQIRLRDVMLLLNCCIGCNAGFVIRSEIKDEQHSRVYSIFTSISSQTRSLLGFYNYDIGSALQTIYIQLVDNPSIYPLHQELMQDKVAFRNKIMNETDKDLKWVKTELSKIDNLDNMPKRYKYYPTLKLYYEEAQILRKEVINNAEPIIYERAYEHAKTKWRKGKYLEDKKEYEWLPDGKKETSVFFFIWTQWERQIREVMMSCFDVPEACHQVHDAVYSKQQIQPKILEAQVLEETGFEVRISID